MSDIQYIRLGKAESPRPRNRRFGLAKPKRHHVLAGLMALGISGAVHYAAYEYLPPFVFARTETTPPTKPFDSFTLEEVNLEPPPSLAPDPLSLPDESSASDSLSDAFEDLGEFIDPAPIPEPAFDSEPLVESLQRAPAEIPELPMPEAIEARQEILAIEKQLFSEEIEALPRSFVPDVPRVQEALDIVLPVEIDLSSPIDLTTTGGTGFIQPVIPGIDPSSLAALAPPSLDDLAPLAIDASLPPPEIAAASLSVERPEDITRIDPVENLLGLKTKTFVDPGDPENIYFKIEIFRKGIEALPVLPKGVILLQDCSESMTQEKLDQCRRGLETWVNTLNEGDLFDVLSFRDQVHSCFGQLTKVNPESRASARWFIKNLESRGRTDVFAALESMYNQYKDSSVPIIGIMMTDGRPTTGLQDSSDIIQKFTRFNSGSLSLFSVGGGLKANAYLLDLLSYRNRGGSMVVPKANDIPRALGQLAGQLRNPVLSGLEFRFTGTMLAEVYPRKLTNLYLDRPLVLYGRVPRNSEDVAFQVIGNSLGQQHDLVFALDLEKGESGDSLLRKIWARHKLYHLIGLYMELRDPSILNSMQALARQYGLRIPYEYDIQGKVGQ